MLLTAIRLKTLRTLAAAGLVFASSALLASTALAADRLALVIGEAGYAGDPLPTAAADAALVAKTLGAQGFDVTELHELGAADLAAGYQAFLAKARGGPTTEITVYSPGSASTSAATTICCRSTRRSPPRPTCRRSRSA